MSEILKSDKAITAEKKRYSSKKEQRAAVSVQTARIIDRLLERSKDLDNYVSPNGTLSVSKHVEDNSSALSRRAAYRDYGGGVEAIHIGSSETKAGILPGNEKTKKESWVTTDVLSRSGDTSRSDLVVDPEGKHRPRVTDSWSIYGTSRTTRGSRRHTPTKEELISNAAPELYKVKKAIDIAEKDQEYRRAA